MTLSVRSCSVSGTMEAIAARRFAEARRRPLVIASGSGAREGGGSDALRPLCKGNLLNFVPSTYSAGLTPKYFDSTRTSNVWAPGSVTEWDRLNPWIFRREAVASACRFHLLKSTMTSWRRLPIAKLYVCFVFEAETRLPTESWRLRTARGAARSSASDATASLFTDAPQASTRSIVPFEI